MHLFSTYYLKAHAGGGRKYQEMECSSHHMFYAYIGGSLTSIGDIHIVRIFTVPLMKTFVGPFNVCIHNFVIGLDATSTEKENHTSATNTPGT